MKTVAIAVISALAGASVATFVPLAAPGDCGAETELASQAYGATTATYVLTFVEALRQLRTDEPTKAIAILEPRLERDLDFLTYPAGASQVSATVSRAIAAGHAYRAEYLK